MLVFYFVVLIRSSWDRFAGFLLFSTSPLSCFCPGFATENQPSPLVFRACTRLLGAGNILLENRLRGITFAFDPDSQQVKTHAFSLKRVHFYTLVVWFSGPEIPP